ncbi:hypothetical protein [Rhodococcus rhodochrous]|uniref:hypothetical protein n=1 Tax=Rhodococcus rhodochrous TaxID=1829 RepID=UPI00128ED5A6|nr:hypothetical protein [Rhodococcus rhodochrous]
MDTADDQISWWTDALIKPLRRQIIEEPEGDLPVGLLPQPGSSAYEDGHLHVETLPEGKFKLAPQQAERIKELIAELDEWWKRLDPVQQGYWLSHQHGAFDPSTAPENSSPPFGVLPAAVGADLPPHMKVSLFLSDYIAVRSSAA